MRIVPVALSFATNASREPLSLVCNGETSGKLVEEVCPVIYMFCAPVVLSRVRPKARSSPDPPRYVQKMNPPPALKLATKASTPPRFFDCAPLVAGRSVELVQPATTILV